MKMLKCYSAAVLAALLLLPAVLLGSISQELSGADSLSVGTPFSFTIIADYAIKNVSIPDSLDEFAIIDSKLSKTNTYTWQLSIVPLKVGALSFPRLQVNPVESSVTAEYTDAFRVHVLSVLAEGDTLLKDIKPMQRYFLQPPFWVYLLILLAIIALVWYLLKNRKPKPKPEDKLRADPVKPVAPAWQKAITSLDELNKQTVDVITYHFLMSVILRTFLEETYRFNALEMTSREIQHTFRKQQLDTSGEIKRFLAYCDMVKFAKVTPESSDIELNCKWLKDYFLSFAKPPTEASDA